MIETRSEDCIAATRQIEIDAMELAYNRLHPFVNLHVSSEHIDEAALVHTIIDLIIELQSLTKIRSKEWINAQPVRLDSDYMYFDEVEITATALWAAIEGYDSFDEIVVGCVGSTPIMAFALAMIAAINASNTSYVRTLIDGQEPIDASELRHTFGRRRRKAQ